MRILMTGGTGAFGRAVGALLPRPHDQLWTPTRAELDILQGDAWKRAFDSFQPEVVVHAAAYTAVDRAEQERERCWQTNVTGTRLGLAAAQSARVRFVYLSTDYVFDGEPVNGTGYQPPDRLGPRNYYGFTKAVADLLVQEYELGAVIRTSFAPDGPWRYPRAFEDLWTGKDYLKVLAPEFALAIRTPFTGIVHICTERKTVLELAQRSRPDVQPMRRADANVLLPRDVWLNISSWEFTKSTWLRLNRSRLRREMGRGNGT